MSPAVYIVDDDASVRDSLSLMLSLNGYRTSTFASAEDFLHAARADWEGTALIDIRLAGMDGLALQERLRTDFPGLAVVVMTAHGDVAGARRAFLANAVDFIEKPLTAGQVLAALGLAASRPSRPRGGESLRSRLSPREAEVLDLVVQGLHNRHIAAQLGISARTVEVHKARIMEKLGARNLVELVRLVDAP